MGQGTRCLALLLLFLALPGLAALAGPPAGTPAEARAETPAEAHLAQTIRKTEAGLGARIGVYVGAVGTSWHWGHRQDERFPMASTFKSLLCGAVLAAADRGTLSLDEPLLVRGDEVHGHAPVTQDRIGQEMTVGALCAATLDLSDNGAANLLIDRMGGPQAVTAFLRSIGDGVTRLDRKEPELNLFAPGDPRDTTSPAAIAASWQRLLLGDVLSPDSRRRLYDWMRPGSVTGGLIRVHLPPGWAIADRSGGGRRHTRAIVALITPPDRPPYVTAIYLSDTEAGWDARNAAVSGLGAAVLQLIAEHAHGR